ncbi:hypothetical protein COCOBI_pt-2290 (chloroplast) [Coccomyxa sp. Obi]|nr:hypothetical protein COCOBI_pt-2290 [Coccomyxa sp. Obi]
MGFKDAPSDKIPCVLGWSSVQRVRGSCFAWVRGRVPPPLDSLWALGGRDPHAKQLPRASLREARTVVGGGSLPHPLPQPNEPVQRYAEPPGGLTEASVRPRPLQPKICDVRLGRASHASLRDARDARGGAWDQGRFVRKAQGPPLNFW